MRRALPALVALVVLPAAAGAKEVTAVTVCGAHACTRLTDRTALDAFMHDGSMAEEAPRAPQRSYLVRVRMGEPGGPGEEWTNRWLPDAGVLASRDETGGMLFTDVGASLERVLRRAAGRHAAYPARRFVRREPAARVVEVVRPPAVARTERATSGGGRWWLIAGGAGALVLLAAAARAMKGERLRRFVAVAASRVAGRMAGSGGGRS